MLLATPSAADDVRERARRHFEAGRAALEVDQFDVAIAEFTSALALSPSPVLLYNIGRANERKGDPGAALVFYRRAVQAPGADAEVVRRGAAAIERVEAVLARAILVLVGVPEGAAAELDSEPVSGLRARTELEVAPGEHVIRVTAPGKTPFEQRVAVSRGRRLEIRVALRAAPARLLLEVDPPSARIRIDGEVRTLVAGRPLVLTPGDHVVTVSAPDRATSEHAVQVEAGRTRTLRVVLERTGGAGPHLRPWAWGTLGASVALLGGGVAATLLAAREQSKIDDAEPRGEITPESREAVEGLRDRYSVTSWVLYGAGGLVAAGAATLFVLSASRSTSPGDVPAALLPAPTDGGALLHLRGTW